jgi:hypothetical protein
MQISISYPEKVNKLIIASAFYNREGAIVGPMEKAKFSDIISLTLSIFI